MELGLLEPLYAVSGPIASVYLDTTWAVQGANREIDLRWRGLRDELAEAGADEATLKALDGVYGGVKGVPGPQGEALFAAEGRVLAAHTLSRPPRRDHASWMALPDPLDLVADRDNGLPYVVVATDRVGADVHAYPTYGGPVEERSFSGSTLHVQKVSAGGWSQKHYERNTEETWTKNAAQVAEDVEAAASDVSAEAVFVGGDERAIGKLKEHLSERVLGILVELPSGGRSDYTALASLRDSLEERLSETVAAVRAEKTSEFTQSLGRDLAVQGLAATAEALRSAQVDTLLLHPVRLDDQELWGSADDPMEVSAERDRLTDPGNAVRASASALLLRAAYATDASFGTLPGEGDAEDGTGALLRFATEE
ncbi:hypothetical protein HDA32_000098 [Spinactinospora alkalitolerans]|uniref:Peptide chain release factor 1 n=1 Tax=Spinactinospora alkalitolerans TaxID=687207 RepID=A0A852TM14_9ACTN|nr:Vms1/Ankzf1 family peptidyl-tRNA hydrolase [Spinactinospora alkalitolerans]NYE44978.1 hypothetical protein [Spinactinospora alkalitolerans]